MKRVKSAAFLVSFAANMTAVGPQIFPSDALQDVEYGRTPEPGCLFIKINDEKPQGAAVDDDVVPKRKLTIAEGLHPLLASMKLFGLYFRRPKSEIGDIQKKKPRARTAYLVYAVAIVVLQWMNAVRMFTCFTQEDVFGLILLHKMIGVIYGIQCAVAQSAFCAASYSGRLEVVFRQFLDDSCARHAHKFSIFYSVVSWTVVATGAAFFGYGLFFTDGYMDSMMCPLQTHIPISHPTAPRIVAWFFGLFHFAAFIFSQTTTFVLTALFSHQFKKVIAGLGQLLDNPQRTVSDSDIEMLRQKHQETEQDSKNKTETKTPSR